MKRVVIALLAATFAGGVAAQSYDDWQVQDLGGDTFAASTYNESGGRLFKVCYGATGNCMWGFAIGPTCIDGDKYPVLVNADSGALNMQASCSGAKKLGQIMLLEGYDFMERISKNDDRIGIALPLQDGAFTVVRFSMNGSTAASASIEESALNSGKRSTKDQAL